MPLIVKNLSAFYGAHLVFKNINFHLNQEQCLLVKGANGSGKTTLLNQISGLTQPDEGSIFFANEPIKKSKTYTEKMLYISHKNYLKENLSIKDNLRLLALIHTKQPSIDEKMILEQANLKVLLSQKIAQLSLGQKKRVLLTQLFFSNKQVWILDEPVSSLDNQSVIFFEQLLAKHLKNKGMAIISSHQNLNIEKAIEINLSNE